MKKNNKSASLGTAAHRRSIPKQEKTASTVGERVCPYSGPQINFMDHLAAASSMEIQGNDKKTQEKVVC